MRSKALFGALGLVVAMSAFPVMVSWADVPPSAPPSQSAPAAEVQPSDQARVQPADPDPAPAQPADPAPTTSQAPEPAPAAAAPADPAPAAPQAADPAPAAPAAPEAADPSPPVRPDGGQPPAVVVPGPTTPVPAPSAGSPTPQPSPPGSASPSPSASPSAPAERSTLSLRQRLVLTGDSDHDGRADRGDTVRVVMSVTNSGGQVTLRSVQVVDSLFRRLGSPVTCGTSVLAPGASTSCSSGSVSIRRGQAKAGVFSNQARATARTASGALVRSAASTATLQVQHPAPRHRHHHKNRKHHKGKHAGRHHHARTHEHRARMRHAKAPSARLKLNQFVLKVIDVNKNGRLEAGDSVRFGFQVSSTGSLPVAGLHIVDRRLTRFKVPITCAATTLDAGAATVCTSGPMKITRYQAKKRLGQNFAYAAATAGGTAVRSNSTVIPLQRSTSALRRLTRLPNTGSSVTERELGYAGLLLLGGAFLLTAGRRRAPLVARQRSLPGADPR